MVVAADGFLGGRNDPINEAGIKYYSDLVRPGESRVSLFR